MTQADAMKQGMLVVENADPFPREEQAQPQQSEHQAGVQTETPGPEMTAEEERAAQKNLLEKAMEETVRRTQESLMSEEIKFKHQQRIGALFAKSGYFSDLKGGDQATQIARAVVKIQLGDAMGLTPMESMQSVYMVNGRPTVDAQVRAARMKRFGYDWDILRHDDKGCKIALKRNGKSLLREDGSVATVEFTEQHAKAAELIGKAGDMYKKYPMNMYFSRCITNAQRWYAPEVLNGANALDASEAVELEDKLAPVKPLFKDSKETAA